ncbi:MAG: glycerol-3-phosphate dehydrogenase [Kiritimatiellia bacterium]|jgi:glycerol-3-phosphate dehydrogenase
MSIVTNKSMVVDAVIFGGGVAGLWMLRSLRAKGYRVLLLEKTGLGGLQTMASQGVLHGGLKYALNGVLSNASETIRDMPGRWKACLDGEGEIDLSKVRMRADHQILWSEGKVTSRITSFFATRALSSRIKKLKTAPEALDHKAYRGVVYQLEEPVIDVPNLVKVLADPAMDSVAHFTHAAFTEAGVVADGVEVQAGRIIFAAGEGNEALMAEAGVPGFPRMQTRPLHQVLVADDHLPPFYSICMGAGTKPVLVITTHETADGTPVWYLGGQLAEAGVTRDADEQIQTAKQELLRLMPWLSLERARWKTLKINRAEPVTEDGEKPAGAYCQAFGRYVVCWPTKLVMAPLLGDELLRLMPDPLAATDATIDFPKPAFSHTPWEHL